MVHLAESDDGHVGAFLHHMALAQLQGVLAFGHLALHAVHLLALHKNDRVVVSNGALEQPLGIPGRAGADDDEARRVAIPAFKALAVLGTQLTCAAAGATEHHGNVELPARHVVHLGGAVDDGVNRDEREVERHELNDGTQTHHGGTHTQAGKAQFADGGVHHALGAKHFQHALADFVGAVVLGYLLAHQKDGLVAHHFFDHRLTQGFAELQNGHGWERFGGHRGRLRALR